MAQALEIQRGDMVTFIPCPRFNSALRVVIELVVDFILRDEDLTLLSFKVDGVTKQVILPHQHTVTINISASSAAHQP